MKRDVVAQLVAALVDGGDRVASVAEVAAAGEVVNRVLANGDTWRAGAFGLVAFDLDGDDVPVRVSVTVQRPDGFGIELWRSALAGADELIRRVEDRGGRLVMDFERGDDE